jgi:lipocalin
VVRGFDLGRDLGGWDEVARPDHRFKHGG